MSLALGEVVTESARAAGKGGVAAGAAGGLVMAPQVAEEGEPETRKG